MIDKLISCCYIYSTKLDIMVKKLPNEEKISFLEKNMDGIGLDATFVSLL